MCTHQHSGSSSPTRIAPHCDSSGSVSGSARLLLCANRFNEKFVTFLPKVGHSLSLSLSPVSSVKGYL